MNKLNIPPIVEQIRQNMLDSNNPTNIRYNYMVTMENIREYCDKALIDYKKAPNRGK
jgi:hypothetical protein